MGISAVWDLISSLDLVVLVSDLGLDSWVDLGFGNGGLILAHCGLKKKKNIMSWKSRGGFEPSTRGSVSRKWTFLFCIGCFCAGMLFSDRFHSSQFLTT